MNITDLLRKWLVANCGVKEDATEDECRKATTDAIVKGDLSPTKLADLTKDPKEEEANEFIKKVDAIADGISKLTEVLTKQEEKKQEEKEKTLETPPETKEKIDLESKETDKMIGKLGGTPADEEKAFNIRVKEAVENYDGTKSALHYPAETKYGKKHKFAGQPVEEFGRPKMAASERDKALAGAWAKFMIATDMRGKSTKFGFEALNQHDKELVCYLCENGEWDDSKDNKLATRKGLPGGYKTLIDSSVSGGTEAAPIVFDDMFIETPLLYGELFPMVNQVPLSRGRRVEGVEVETVTGSWGGIDDTSISLFDTTSYVLEFNTTVYRWQGSVKIGLDFLSDTPIDFSQLLSRQYGERLLEDLDDVIAAGNGTTQPQGVVNTSGVTSVNFSGSTTIGAYESLRFGVAKPEHGANVKNSAIFCGTETSYQRARAIPVGTSDARRLFGMDYDSYSIMNRPYKINESLTNQQIFYAIMARYRMYRRRGFVLRTSTEGDTLIRDNSLLIVAMARYGGQQERGATVAYAADAPA